MGEVVDFKTNLLHVKGHEVYFFNSNLPDLQILKSFKLLPKEMSIFPLDPHFLFQ